MLGCQTETILKLHSQVGLYHVRKLLKVEALPIMEFIKIFKADFNILLKVLQTGYILGKDILDEIMLFYHVNMKMVLIITLSCCHYLHEGSFLFIWRAGWTVRSFSILLKT